MEIVLNLVWLAVSVALLVILGIHARRAGEDSNRGKVAIALVCLVCFLFPVISMTDDLNGAGPALLEPTKLKKLVHSAHSVLILLPWTALQVRREITWPALDSQLNIRRPLLEIFSFDLSRRPPPLRLAMS